MQFRIGPWKISFLLFIVVTILSLGYALYLVIQNPRKYINVIFKHKTGEDDED